MHMQMYTLTYAHADVYCKDGNRNRDLYIARMGTETEIYRVAGSVYVKSVHTYID